MVRIAQFLTTDKTFGKNMDIISCKGKAPQGSGSRLLGAFIKAFSEEFLERVHLFSRTRKNDGIDQHVFYYKERQIKGQIAAALDRVCDGLFIQEPSVSRKPSVTKEMVMDNGLNNDGWADFWCRYGGKTKISLLIELKHSWARYYSPDKMTVYKSGIKRHESALKQVKSIQKSDYLESKGLYGLALTVMPLYMRHDKHIEPTSLHKNQLSSILETSHNEYEAHVSYGCAMPKDIHFVASWVNEGKSIYESYPGIILLWSVVKIHRDRQ